MSVTPEERTAAEAAQAKYPGNPWWESPDRAVRALWQLSEPILLIDWGDFRGGVEELLERPVWTHEFANPQRLLDEASGKRPRATFADVLDAVPGGKDVIVVRAPAPPSGAAGGVVAASHRVDPPAAGTVVPSSLPLPRTTPAGVPPAPAGDGPTADFEVVA